MTTKENIGKESLNNSTDLKLWIDIMRSIPCATYILKPDSELSFVAGNERFYKDFDLSKDILSRKYGNKLGALLVLESSELFSNLEDIDWTLGKEGHLEVCVRIKNANIWLHTEYISFEADNQVFILCVSFDITNEVDRKGNYIECSKVFEFVAKHKVVDCFEYDFNTDKAKVYCCNVIFENTMIDENRYYHNFSEKILREGMVTDEHIEIVRDFWTKKPSKTSKGIMEFKIIADDSSKKWIKLAYEPKEGKEGCIIGVFEDITAEREYTQNYLKETQFYHAMLSDKDAYAQLDATEDRVTKIGGMWNLYNEVIDKITYSQLINEFIEKVVHPDDRKHYSDFMQPSNFVESLRNGINRLSCEFRRIVDQNKMVWIQIDVHLFKDPISEHTCCLAYLKNIDALKKQTLSLKRISEMDNLTNVYSRHTLETNIREYLASAREMEINSFFIVDIENFREINENYGYNVGDEVLVSLANTLSDIFRKTDIIGRYERDKFIVFLKDIDSKEWVSARVDQFFTALKENANLHSVNCNIGISNSVGVVSYERIYRQGNIALSMAKASKDEKYVFFDTEEAEKFMGSKESENENFIPTVVLNNFEDRGHKEMDFDTFMSEQGEIAYLVDPDSFDLILGNAAFYSRMGVTEEQCIGRTCYEILHKRENPCPFCSKVNWTTDKFYVWKNMNLILEQEFLIKNKLVNWNGKEVMLALAVDISNDKSIVDSIEANTGAGDILGAVQHLDEAPSTVDAIYSALEDIGAFFRAKSVHFWEKTDEFGYICTNVWSKSNSKEDTFDVQCNIESWIGSQRWNHQIIIETPEAILRHSFEIYRFMQKKGIQNQRWIKISAKNREYGYVCVNNISANFQNMAFLESFSVFFAGELRNRKLIEGALYSDNHDVLTGLLSRHNFEKVMMTYNKDEVSSVGVLIGNFNDLKGINSNVGIQSGNNYIKKFAEMLERTFIGDKIFRLNGDEFLVLIFNCSIKNLENMAENLNSMMVDNSYFSVSIGYSWDNVEKDIHSLMEEATKTMHVNKKRYYDSSNKTDGSERRKMLSELMTSIDNKCFEVYLQSKIDMKTGKMVGAEALVRYRDENQTIVAPAKFIESFERNSLIRYVDLFVFENVCKLQKKWIDEGKHVPTISINFSRITIQEMNISDTINDIVNEYGIPKRCIEIEITESAASMGKSTLYRAAKEIRDKSFAISLDDFGTKYTNLAIIADIDFDVLKLDKSLVDKLENEFKYQAIAKNVIVMCESMGIKVIAEGVETQAQADKLIELGCRYCQGYLYSKPVEISEFELKYAQDLESDQEKILI